MKCPGRNVILGLLMLGWLAQAGVAQDVQTNAVMGVDTNGLAKWEVGLFGLVSQVPFYRGSDEYRMYALPLPYGVYRGDYIQADRDGLRGKFYSGYRFELELSMSGNPPVQDEGGARADMPELDPLLEAGPAARLYLHHGEKVKAVFLEFAVRGVFSIDMDDLSPGYEGLRSSLSMVMAGYRPRPDAKWGAGIKGGLEFTDQSYNSYFYNVDETYVTPERPYYQSDGGYGGVFASGWLSRRLFDGVSVATFVRFDNVSGAVFEDSPLVRAENSYMVGVGFTWKITQSSQLVKRAKP